MKYVKNRTHVSQNDLDESISKCEADRSNIETDSLGNSGLFVIAQICKYVACSDLFTVL